ncbi:MAG: hypothetical protein HN509_08940 [Halobacteriovoraceae bacterium]|jgi:hypothetical protein|nr:hypothetical protein [Halobacteriovoraceae bacterium]MBT5095936.1 hypothetical protein [Halobacteriovoraceae bacterium]
MTKLLFIFLLLSASSMASDCRPNQDNCNAYLCVEAQKSCGVKGYPIGFGYKYCQKFDRKKKKFSKDGRAWIKRVRLCLQEKIINSPGLNCKQYRGASITQHADCYADTGYCSLSKRDRRKVTGVVGWKAVATPFYVTKTWKQLRKRCRDKGHEIDDL